MIMHNFRFELLKYFVFAAVAFKGALAADVFYQFDITNADISPDGFARSASLVNGQFPGTLIQANKGDTLYLNVSNQLTDETMRRSTSIHWHGLFQNRTATEDGPAFVTQCPISPAHWYQYVIPLKEQTGTFWYHSHLGTQYIDGLRGALVVYDPEDPHLDLYDVDDASTVLELSDWHHTPAEELMATFLADTTSFQEPVPDSGLINGKGRYVGGDEVERTVVSVAQGTRYRFRLINNSGIARFRCSIENHKMTIIEADGISMEPLEVDYLDIHAGQRYSFVLSADQDVANYWIRCPLTVRGSATNSNLDANDVLAVLRYDGAEEAEPTTDVGTASGTALVEANMVTLIDPGAPGGNTTADKTFNLAFSRGVNSEGKAAFFINGVQYVPPTTPTLLNILANGLTSEDQFTDSEQTFVIERGDIVEINITGAPNHPFHLHGHAFDVVRSAGGSLNYDNPPRRDVVASGSGTGISIRFRADNPGPWILHCHIDWHLEAGLALVFAEAPSDQISGDYSVAHSAAWDELCDIYESLDASMQ